MSIALDGENLFDEQQVEIELGGFSRQSIERTIPGLDGMLSIDRGERGRKIKQKGVLRAKSQVQMGRKIDAVSVYMDGDTHVLTTNNGEEFNNLRMDAFKVSKERASGGGLCCDYEIVYTQLAV